MKFLRVSKDHMLGEGMELRRMRGTWFMKRGHWYECTLSGESGFVWMDSMNVHCVVEIVELFQYKGYAGLCQ